MMMGDFEEAVIDQLRERVAELEALLSASERHTELLAAELAARRAKGVV